MGRLLLAFSPTPSGIGLVTLAGGNGRARGADTLAACSARPTADLRAKALACAISCAALSEAAFAWAALGETSVTRVSLALRQRASSLSHSGPFPAPPIACSLT